MKQSRRSQQQMLGKQMVQAVLHSGCQDPHAFLQGVMLGSRPCLNCQEGLQDVAIRTQLMSQETGGSPQGAKELRDGERRTEEE